MYGRPRIYETKTITNNGCRMHLFREEGQESWKLHNWDGPAIEPLSKGGEAKPEYYLYGNLLTKDEWSATLKDREGLPWYKNTSMKNKLTDTRN
jgi:hypothetical protein